MGRGRPLKKIVDADATCISLNLLLASQCPSCIIEQINSSSSCKQLWNASKKEILSCNTTEQYNYFRIWSCLNSQNYKTSRDFNNLKKLPMFSKLTKTKDLSSKDKLKEEEQQHKQQQHKQQQHKQQSPSNAPTQSLHHHEAQNVHDGEKDVEMIRKYKTPQQTNIRRAKMKKVKRKICFSPADEQFDVDTDICSPCATTISSSLSTSPSSTQSLSPLVPSSSEKNLCLTL